MFESGLRTFAPSHLRTIGTSIDVNGRFFMTEIRATQGFSLFFAQPKSTYINLLMWIQLQLRLYPDLNRHGFNRHLRVI